MSTSAPDPDVELVRASVRWSAGLVDAVDEVARLLGGLSDEVARDWLDDRGREWVQRAAGLRRDLARHADAALEVTDVLRRWAVDGADSGGPPAAVPPLEGSPVAVPPAPGSAAARSGVRLGDTRAARTDDERGVRIADLPDQPDPGQPGPGQPGPEPSGGG